MVQWGQAKHEYGLAETWGGGRIPKVLYGRKIRARVRGVHVQHVSNGRYAPGMGALSGLFHRHLCEILKLLLTTYFVNYGIFLGTLIQLLCIVLLRLTPFPRSFIAAFIHGSLLSFTAFLLALIPIFISFFVSPQVAY